MKTFAAACVTALLLSMGAASADEVTDGAAKKVAAGKYVEAIADLDAALKKTPASAEYKKALAGAHFAQGQATMNDAALPPMRKYPAALTSFRTTLKLDPQHAGAKADIKMIEDIYTSMGRPIPQ